MTGAVALRAEKITRRLPGDIPVTLVDQADVVLRRGEMVAITGPSGSGKSSLLYMLGLLDRPTSGRLWLGEREVTHTAEEDLADLRLSQIGFVFQFHFLLPEFTALENVLLPLQRAGRLAPAAQIERAENLLTRLGLADHRHKRPRQMSGGQQQRVAIARALANDPPIVLTDEPTGNLDRASGAIVQQILHELAHQQDRAVAIVTHDKDVAAKTDRTITIVDGKITAA